MARSNPFLSSPMVVCLALTLAGCSEDEPATAAADVGVVDSGVDSGADTGVGADTGAGADTGSDASGDAGAVDSGSPAETGAGDAGAVPTCEAYCSAVTANCVGARNTQYIDKARCLSICAKLTVGTLADKDGDTLGCRLAHANAAKDSPDVSCSKAGATGGVACGATRCEAFCKLAMAQCPTGAPFSSESDCKAKCPESSFNASAGEIDMTGGTLNCMQYHLQAAYQGSAAATTHCPHLTITSGPCGP